MATSATSQKRTITPQTAWTLLVLMAASMLLFTIFRPLDYLRASGLDDPAVGLSLPWLQLDPLTGEAQAVDVNDLQGHVTMLSFWGTWCPPCRRDFPHIEELFEAHRNHGDFQLWAVSCPAGPSSDRQALHEKTQEFLEYHRSEMPTYSDLNRTTQQAVNQIVGMQGYPTTIVFDRQGTIRGVWRGYSPADTPRIKSLLSNLLAES